MYISFEKENLQRHVHVLTDKLYQSNLTIIILLNLLKDFTDQDIKNQGNYKYSVLGYILQRIDVFSLKQKTSLRST